MARDEDLMIFRTEDFKGKPCKNCGKKGLHLRGHPHASGYKDSFRIECRYCHKVFVKRKPTTESKTA